MDFDVQLDRKRLSPVATKTIIKLAKHWKLTTDETIKLFSISRSTWYKMQHSPVILTSNQLTRVSFLIGIYKRLHLLFVNDMADRWIKLKNSGPLFNDKTPVELMIDDSIPAMLEVRLHLESLMRFS